MFLPAILKQEMLDVHHIEDEQPHIPALERDVDSTRKPGCGQGEAEEWHKSEVLRTLSSKDIGHYLEARTLGTT